MFTKDTKYNWFGYVMWAIHNVLLGPEYDLSPFEEKMILKYGVKK